MGTITLLNLRTRAKDKANMENSEFVTDAIWNTYINYAITDLRDIITSKVGEDYFATVTSSTTLTSNQETLALPADFYKLLWVEVLVNQQAGVWKKLGRFEVTEQVGSSYPHAYGSYPGLKYRLRASNVWFNPAGATGGKTVRLWYVPLHTDLSADGDTLNGYNGWDEYVVLLAARKALVKEEQDVSDLEREILAMNQRIEAMAPNRDQAEPCRIYDNERSNYDEELWPYVP